MTSGATNTFSAKYTNPTETQAHTTTKTQGATEGKLARMECSLKNTASITRTTPIQNMENASSTAVGLENLKTVSTDAHRQMPTQNTPLENSFKNEAQALFLTNIPLARKIIHYALYQGIITDHNAASTSVSNSDLLQITHQFYQENQPANAEYDTNINHHLQGMQLLINRMEAKKSDNESARSKLEWFLENACSILDTTLYDPSDLLVSDGRLAKNTQDEAMICTKAKIALSYALQQLPHADWNTQTTWLPQAPAQSQMACLEKIVSLQTILQNTEGLFNDHIPHLLATSNALHTPTREEQNAQAAQHHAQIQNFAQQMQQMFAVRQGGNNQGAQQQLDLIAQIPRPQPIRIEAYQAKMRSLISAAAALVKLGTPEQKNQSLDFVAQVKTLFDSSKDHVYNLNQERSIRTGILLRQARERENAAKHDTLLNKALCVQIMAGEPQEAIHYLQSTFDSTIRQTEMLINLISVTQKNKSLSPDSCQAALFKQPLSQLTETVLDDSSMDRETKAHTLKNIAKTFHEMNLLNEASTTLDKSIACFTESAHQLNMNSLEPNDLAKFSNTIEDMNSLIKTMIHLDQTDKIKPMIDQQPEDLKPYLLAHTCETLYQPKKRKIDDTASPNSTLHSYWVEAKSIAMHHPNIFRKVDALLYLTSTRYKPFQESGEAEAIIQSVRAMNDGSVAFREAFQAYEYRVGSA
jgi:hypothetical protein